MKQQSLSLAGLCKAAHTTPVSLTFSTASHLPQHTKFVRCLCHCQPATQPTKTFNHLQPNANRQPTDHHHGFYQSYSCPLHPSSPLPARRPRHANNNPTTRQPQSLGFLHRRRPDVHVQLGRLLRSRHALQVKRRLASGTEICATRTRSRLIGINGIRSES
ncbi:hypothetical protein BDZ85DRAFT_261123 [Elsinoe ampelina]|uniref:Uncharacterized protein n=1 Tax=Elsinoe ampelina TaxID=302913 RepID=A0A6A6GFM5_9PEZI|nr:hypothetical protein BDZ85DRAFT_261123 [Elsinoe ampelina]